MTSEIPGSLWNIRLILPGDSLSAQRIDINNYYGCDAGHEGPRRTFASSCSRGHGEGSYTAMSTNGRLKIVFLFALANFQIGKPKFMQFPDYLFAIADLDVNGYNFHRFGHLGNLAAEHFGRQVKR